MPEVRWVMSHRFRSKFHTLFSSAKILKIGQDLTKLQRVSRWELFETQCIRYITSLQKSAHPHSTRGWNLHFAESTEVL